MECGERKNNCIKGESNPRRIDAARRLVATIQVTTTPLMLEIDIVISSHQRSRASSGELIMLGHVSTLLIIYAGKGLDIDVSIGKSFQTLARTVTPSRLSPVRAVL